MQLCGGMLLLAWRGWSFNPNYNGGNQRLPQGFHGSRALLSLPEGMVFACLKAGVWLMMSAECFLAGCGSCLQTTLKTAPAS